MSIEIVKCTDVNEAINKASEKLNNILEKLKEQNVAVLLLMSGGSALKIAEHIEKSFLPKNLTLGVLDDRYSKDENINNFSQLARTQLYADAVSVSANFIDTHIVGEETIDEVALRADTAIKNWEKNNPHGKIIITQGIGPDGHTSGIMPFPEDENKFRKLFIDTDKYVVGYDAENKNQYPLRITATLNFLIHKVDESALLMTGKEKVDAYENALHHPVSLAQIPASVVRHLKQVYLFTDIG